MLKIIKIFKEFIKAHFKMMLHYRINSFVDIIVQFFTYFVSYMTIWIILSRFSSINDWTYYEIVFLYNFNMFTWAIAGLFLWGPLYEIGYLVKEGAFDAYLIYPINPLFYLMCKRFSHSFFGQIITGIIIFIFCFMNFDLNLTVLSFIYFFIVLIGAILIQASIIIFTITLGFWFIDTTFVQSFVLYPLRKISDYPISIYNHIIRFFVSFIIPVAFVNYYPSAYFLAKSEAELFHPYFRFGTPVLGIVMIILSILFWNFGISRYKSSGS